MPAMLMTASAMATSARTAVISLTRSGVRPGRARRRCQARPGPAADDMAICRLGRREPQHVADAAQRVQQVGLGGVDLAPQYRDVGLHDPGIPAEVVVPDVVEDLHLGQHPVGVAHEVPEQLELRGRQLDLLAGPPYLVAVLVELQVGELQPGRGPAALAPGAAGSCSDSGVLLLQTSLPFIIDSA